MGYWRRLYALFGIDYPEKPDEKTVRVRHEMLRQIRNSKLKLKSPKGRKRKRKRKKSGSK